MHDDDKALYNFTNLYFPIITNLGAIIVSPLTGALVSRHGLALPLALLVVSAESTIGMCLISVYSEGRFGAWPAFMVLVFYAMLTGSLYTLQFSYLLERVPPKTFGLAVALTTICQALAGLIAFPGLSPNPFGDQNQYPLLILCGPTLLTLSSPWLEARAEREAARTEKGPTLMV